MTGNDHARTTDASTPRTRLTRRQALRSAAAAGALATGLGTGAIGGATAGLAAFDDLSVDSDERIVDESDEPFVMRGLNVADPKRIDVSRHVRGKTATQVVDHVTDPDEDWYPRVIRVPASPVDIGEHPTGDSGPEYEDGELANPDAVSDDRRKARPPQPPAFTREQLRDYLDEYYDPVVERCRERGVYCIVDFHRRWHEQPPGTADPWGQENHLPYDSEYTNYWAYNEHYGRDEPASWGHVVASYQADREGTWSDPALTDESDLPGTPFAEDAWQVNEALLEEAEMFWDEAAERYADEPHVVFEPYNEPTAPGIWGPVEGCGAVRQKPLWRTYLYDFATPIVEAIREHAPEKLLLMGVPGRCRGTQGLHWENFAEAGFENVAVTWHNYGGDPVSQIDFWLNDTDYESLQAIEDRTNPVPDPFPEPPEDVDDPACWGWERHESGGLQNAMDHHPVAVTEFGWMDGSPDVWYGEVSPSSTTFEYGEPFIEAMESDDRISWVAFAADVGWEPSMFDVPWPTATDELDLVNGNWYHEDTAVSAECEDLPCEWDLLDNPDSGQYVKRRLYEHRADAVPFDGVSDPIPEPDISLYPDASPTALAVEWSVDWSLGGDVDHYEVSLDETVVARPEETSVVLTGLDPATTYEVSVTAVGPDGRRSFPDTETMETEAGTRPSPVGDADSRPTDPDADGLYEDVNGNGEGDLADAVELFQHRDSQAVTDHAAAYDFSGNDEVDLADVVQVFTENTN